MLKKCRKKTRVASNRRFNRPKMERLSIQGDKNTAYRISRNLAYGQFARRFSCDACPSGVRS